MRSESIWPLTGNRRGCSSQHSPKVIERDVICYVIELFLRFSLELEKLGNFLGSDSIFSLSFSKWNRQGSYLRSSFIVKVQILHQLLKSVYLEQCLLYSPGTIEIINVILKQKYKPGLFKTVSVISNEAWKHACFSTYLADNTYQMVLHTRCQNYFLVGAVLLTAVDFYSWNQRNDYSNGFFDLYLLEASTSSVKSWARCQMLMSSSVQDEMQEIYYPLVKIPCIFMRALKSSATIQQEHVIQLMAMLILNLLVIVYADFVHVSINNCGALKPYSSWQVIHFIKIKITLLPLQAITKLMLTRHKYINDTGTFLLPGSLEFCCCM